MKLFKKLRLGLKQKPRPEPNSPAYLEGLPEGFLRSEYPVEYMQMKREQNFLSRAWRP